VRDAVAFRGNAARGDADAGTVLDIAPCAALAAQAIGRAAGCPTGTASKRRVRYAEHRFSRLEETGERGNDPKYTETANQLIPAALDQPVPVGYTRWLGA